MKRQHAAHVDAWLDQEGRDADVGRLLELLDEGISRLWGRALLTLGEITLAAIADRVMYAAAQRHPILKGMKIGPTGIGAPRLAEHDGELTREVVDTMARYLLTELLTVIGTLTADILTPALYAELTAEHDAVEPASPTLHDPSTERPASRRPSGDRENDA